MFLPHGHGQVEAGGPPVAGLHHVRLGRQLGRQLEAHVGVRLTAVPGGSTEYSTVQYRVQYSTVQYSTVQYSTDLAGVAGHHVHGDEEEGEEVQQPRASAHHQGVAVPDVDKSER